MDIFNYFSLWWIMAPSASAKSVNASIIQDSKSFWSSCKERLLIKTWVDYSFWEILWITTRFVWYGFGAHQAPKSWKIFETEQLEVLIYCYFWDQWRHKAAVIHDVTSLTSNSYLDGSIGIALNSFPIERMSQT